jgi:hypothetical protein
LRALRFREGEVEPFAAQFVVSVGVPSIAAMQPVHVAASVPSLK